MTNPSSNADQLYWQRTHTLVETMDFDEASNSYLVKGYKQK